MTVDSNFLKRLADLLAEYDYCIKEVPSEGGCAGVYIEHSNNENICIFFDKIDADSLMEELKYLKDN